MLSGGEALKQQDTIGGKVEKVLSKFKGSRENWHHDRLGLAKWAGDSQFRCCATVAIYSGDKIKEVGRLRRQQCHIAIWTCRLLPRFELNWLSMPHSGKHCFECIGKTLQSSRCCGLADGDYLEVITSSRNMSSQLQSGTGNLWSPTKICPWKPRTSQERAGLWRLRAEKIVASKERVFTGNRLILTPGPRPLLWQLI